MDPKANINEQFSIGDIVRVSPVNPLAVGRGIGVIGTLGDTIVRVKFPRFGGRLIACLRCDCKLIRRKS